MNDARCEECGCLVEDDYYLCYWCAQREQAIEVQIRNMREEEFPDEYERYKIGVDPAYPEGGEYEIEMSELRDRTRENCDGGAGLTDQRNQE